MIDLKVTDARYCSLITSVSGHLTVAKVNGTGDGSDAPKVARLFALAPRMLEMLRRLDSYLDFNESWQSSDMIEEPKGINEVFVEARKLLAEAVDF